MAKVVCAVLAGKQISLPHTEQGSRPINFRENGEAYVNDFKRDKKGALVLDEDKNTVAVERGLTASEAEGVAEHYKLFGVLVS